MNASANTTLWARYGPEPVRESFDVTEIIFDPSTGETHFLNELPSLLLSVVQHQPLSLNALIGRLAGDVEVSEQGREDILATLQFLAGAEIIEHRGPL